MKNSVYFNGMQRFSKLLSIVEIFRFVYIKLRDIQSVLRLFQDFIISHVQV